MFVEGFVAHDTGLVPLAEELNDYTVSPGILGFIVFAVLGVAVWILLRSLSRHLGRIDFEEGGKGRAEAREEKGDGEGAEAGGQQPDTAPTT
jgi:hypothetical protein